MYFSKKEIQAKLKKDKRFKEKKKLNEFKLFLGGHYYSETQSTNGPYPKFIYEWENNILKIIFNNQTPSSSSSSRLLPSQQPYTLYTDNGNGTFQVKFKYIKSKSLKKISSLFGTFILLAIASINFPNNALFIAMKIIMVSFSAFILIYSFMYVARFALDYIFHGIFFRSEINTFFAKK